VPVRPEILLHIEKGLKRPNSGIFTVPQSFHLTS
jgi:hypothetical protein